MLTVLVLAPAVHLGLMQVVLGHQHVRCVRLGLTQLAVVHQHVIGASLDTTKLALEPPHAKPVLQDRHLLQEPPLVNHTIQVVPVLL